MADAGAGFPFRAGSIINGKYEIERLIGEGGVGIVVAAKHIDLDERVALKFLRPEMLAREDIVGRFTFEAKAASTIKSDHSATVFDVGRTPEGIPYLVMEFLEGRDLASVIEKGRLTVREVSEYAMHTCEALAAAHAKGIVHRDIKPENLFIEERAGMRSIKVLDFGISKTALTGTAAPTLKSVVKTQNLMGTPLYMSPEQIRSPELVDARTDIYALGVVMYEALTGTLPILGASVTALCAAILEQEPTPIISYRPDLPPQLVSVIHRCLAKEQRHRYQNAAEVAIALLPFAPKRSRICAERAGETLVAAGLASPESVRFASDLPASLGSGAAVIIPPLSKLTPIDASGMVAIGTPTPAPSKRSWLKLGAIGATLVVGLVAALIAVRNRSVEPPKALASSAPPPAAEPPPMDISAMANEPKAPPTAVATADPPPAKSFAPRTPARPRASAVAPPPTKPTDKKADAIETRY